MNCVLLIGRLTRDPEIRYTSGEQMADLSDEVERRWKDEKVEKDV